MNDFVKLHNSPRILCRHQWLQFICNCLCLSLIFFFCTRRVANLKTLVLYCRRMRLKIVFTPGKANYSRNAILSDLTVLWSCYFWWQTSTVIILSLKNLSRNDVLIIVHITIVYYFQIDQRRDASIILNSISKALRQCSKLDTKTFVLYWLIHWIR